MVKIAGIPLLCQICQIVRKVKVVFLSAVWYTRQAVKILKKQKAVLSEKRTKRRNEVYYGFSKNERGRRGWKDHSWY